MRHSVYVRSRVPHANRKYVNAADYCRNAVCAVYVPGGAIKLHADTTVMAVKPVGTLSERNDDDAITL